ncbi:T9SS type A sorting domain-containing protein [Flavobacterium sp. N1994]|uniref:T9SS type A sorting domain-containing protein n=1 Tax=Flavobacterium sp. N1994 TaxID=2986827 RepID=UPI002221955A|nr:T9SS type A sorting domain-containing protein [Flavobacterium sp. N1994]
MRKLVVVLFALTTKMISQNLVSNPSFETYSSCPDNNSQIDKATSWHVTSNSASASPDYYNSCYTDSSTLVGVPANIVGNQSAYDGTAYAGIFCYFEEVALREYIQSQLISPLVAGQRYYVSFWVSSADRYGLTINSLGAYCSTTPISGDGSFGPIAVFPQVNSSSMLSDATNWTQITGSFIATGGEQYITIGNFSSDAATQHVVYNPNSLYTSLAYYYIDMVEVSTSSLSISQFHNATLSILPNPFKDSITLDYENKSVTDTIEIYTISGQLVKKVVSGVDTISLGDLPTGVYFISVDRQLSGKLVSKLVKL